MESFELSCLANIVAGLIVAWAVHKWINHKNGSGAGRTDPPYRGLNPD